MIFDKKIITDKRELLEYQLDIAELFCTSFNKKLGVGVWEWAYIDNVCGEPIVSLFYHHRKLVGHYAVIPVNLKCKKKSILAGLSMTTMVDPDYRRLGIFTEQANLVYEKAVKRGFSLVYGFPNSKSEPGFRKRLGWTIENDSSMIRIQGKNLIGREFYLRSHLSFNYMDDSVLEWRLSKPNKEYIKNKELIFKKFNKDFDIIFHCNDFSGIDLNQYYNIFIDDKNNFKDFESKDYVFGYKIFDKSMANYKFKIDLILSDIF